MKRYRLIIDDDAKADLKDGEIWYNGRAEKLGDRFKKEVKRQFPA